MDDSFAQVERRFDRVGQAENRSLAALIALIYNHLDLVFAAVEQLGLGSSRLTDWPEIRPLLHSSKARGPELAPERLGALAGRRRSKGAHHVDLDPLGQAWRTCSTISSAVWVPIGVADLGQIRDVPAARTRCAGNHRFR